MQGGKESMQTILSIGAHDPEKHVLDLIGEGYRFSDKIMRNWSKRAA